MLDDDSRIVDQDVDLLELLRQRGNKVLDLLRVANVQFDRVHLDTITNFRLDLSSELVQCVDAARRHDKLQVLGRGARELQGSALSDAGGGAGNNDGLALEALCHCGGHGASDSGRLDG